MSKHRFMNWYIEKNVKPIPDRRHDYDFWRDDYDGDNELCGTASSVLDAVSQIGEIEKDLIDSAVAEYFDNEYSARNEINHGKTC